MGVNDGRVMASGGGVATEKKPKKTVPNLKFAVAFGFFRFFCGTFLVFFGLNFDKKFQPFKNHVNNVVLGGQELPNNTFDSMPIEPCKCLSKAIITNKNHLTRTRKTSQNWPKWKNRKNRKNQSQI